jgi:hypothetical protein
MALRVKIGPDKAEAEGFGGSKVEADNAIWTDFRRSPKGRGRPGREAEQPQRLFASHMSSL